MSSRTLPKIRFRRDGYYGKDKAKKHQQQTHLQEQQQTKQIKETTTAESSTATT